MGLYFADYSGLCIVKFAVVGHSDNEICADKILADVQSAAV